MDRAQIIDTHVHFWDMHTPDPGMRWIWVERDHEHEVMGNIDAIKSLRYDIHAVWAEARFADVSGFVHVQAAIGSDDPVAETRWLTRMRASAPVPFSIIGHADLGSETALDVLERHLESPYFVGVRDFAAEGLLASGEIAPTYERSLRWMSSRDLIFDVDCQWMSMPALAQLASRHPELQIVLEHIGFPRSRDEEYLADWRSGLKALSDAPNVTCKISGVGMTDPHFTPQSLRPWVDACLETFGDARCVLGSNWPVDRLFSSYDVIMGLYRTFLSELSADEQKRVLSENAARLYRL